MEHPDPAAPAGGEADAYRAPHLPGLPRFCGGAVGYAGYDAVRYVENLPNPPPDDRGLPDLCFAFYDRMVIFDHINKTIAAVAHAHVRSAGRPGGRSYQAACERVDRLVERLQQGVADLPVDRHRARRRGRSTLPLQLRAGRVRGGGREVQGVHQGRRHLPGRPQPALANRDQGPAF